MQTGVSMDYSGKVSARTAEIKQADRLERERYENNTEKIIQRGLELRSKRRELLDLGSAVFAALKEKGVGPDLEAVDRSNVYSRPFKKLFKQQVSLQEQVTTTGWLLRDDAQTRGIPAMHSSPYRRGEYYGGLLSTDGGIMTFDIPPIRGFVANPLLERSDEIGRFPSIIELQGRLSSSPTRIAIKPRLYHDDRFGLYCNILDDESGEPNKEIYEKSLALRSPESLPEYDDMIRSDSGMTNGLLTLASIHDLRI